MPPASANSGVKRRQLEAGSQASASQGSSVNSMTVGKGDYAQPIVMALAQAVTQTENRLATLEHVLSEKYVLKKEAL